MKLVYLGLGSNLGNREGTLQSALQTLEGADLQFVRASGLYETEPIGLREQPWFMNLVAEFRTNLFPRQLLHRIQRVELALGRRRMLLNGPRTIDIDILLYGNSVVKMEALDIPHPRFRDRRFVLEPLAELNAGLRDPVSGLTVAELLQRLEGQAVRRLPASG